METVCAEEQKIFVELNSANFIDAHPNGLLKRCLERSV